MRKPANGIILGVLVLQLVSVTVAQGLQPSKPDSTIDLSAGWAAFLDIYREVVELNTARSGNCARAAEAVPVRLKAAGFAN